MTVFVRIVITTVLAQTAPKAASNRLDIPIQAVRISDDDGGRPTAITPRQVKRWIDYANAVYAHAGVHFRYEISDGLAERRSTLLNNIDGTADRDWLQSKRAGNLLAAEHPGKLTVLFRHGPGPNPTGHAFSWIDYDFVAMVAFDVSTVCGRQNIGNFAHEVGHYLGLSHAFKREFDTVTDADAWLKDHRGDLACFDGDGLSDTPPDPFIKALQCKSEGTILLQGQRIVIDRNNIMGYWPGPRPTVSLQQVEIVRWFVHRRMQTGMLLATNREARHPLEAEALEISGRRGVRTDTRNMNEFGAGNWSGDTQLSVKGGPGSGLTFEVLVEKSGRYRLSAYLTMGPDFAEIQPRLDGEPLGRPINLYAPRVMVSGRVELGTRTLRAGRHALGIDITGKSRASTGTELGIDCFEFASEGGESTPRKAR
jgi:Pregnancy-associated plasma protein-A